MAAKGNVRQGAVGWAAQAWLHGLKDELGSGAESPQHMLGVYSEATKEGPEAAHPASACSAWCNPQLGLGSMPAQSRSETSP